MGALAEEYELYGDERERIGIEKGIEKGREQGLEEGREQGLEEGRLKEQDRNIEFLSQLVLERHADSGEPLDQIVDSLSVLPEYRDLLLERVRKELSDGGR